ncbi:MAG: LysR family transcriptional regulator, partial [Pusillimonas sp.]|nr:LysR family transcriptional regulator [Pusillimonas sp.]
MELKDIDLNLLLVFRELLVERSVSGAAERLGLSQPAVSHALKRLRQLTRDDLFIRTLKGMMPTPYASAMAEPVNQALELLYETLNQQSEFRPHESRRKFIIGMSDLGE